jgi:hypothetical protein
MVYFPVNTNTIRAFEKSPLGDLGVREISEANLGGSDLEQITQRIESSQTDLTANYSDWLNIGFALADELGEAGRDYYHRISRFHPDYSASDCNTQYDNCLKANGHGITIKTLFHLAKSAGINISFPHRTDVACNVSARHTSKKESSTDVASYVSDSGSEEQAIFNTPKIPSHIYNQLPEILKQSTDLFEEGIEKDVFLIGAIAVLSGCLPNIEGIYFDEPVSPHLYAFITAPAGSGKGKMKWSKYFGQQIHDNMVEQSRKERMIYESEIENYNNLTRAQRKNNEKPLEPPRKMFYIPANSSSSAFIQALSDNNFRGVIFETEADTLTGTFKQEWGNFSDVLRKAFHHESTSMFRRKDSEFIEIKDPHMGIALSGTPRQVHNMMPDVENGLFSRFLYYAFEDNSEFKNPFLSHRPVNYTDFFSQKATIIFDLYQQLEKLQQPITFELSPEQGDQFTLIFSTMLSRGKLLLGRDFDANIKRLGLVTFRIAMIFSSLRIIEEGDLSSPMLCTHQDFQSAIDIAVTLEKHAIAVFQNLPNNKLKGIKLKFFDALPKEFNRQGYLETAHQLGIKDKTSEKYIALFKESKLLEHEHNKYSKINT